MMLLQFRKGFGVKKETPTLPFSVACFVIGSVVSTEYSYAEKFDVYDHGPINIYL